MNSSSFFAKPLGLIAVGALLLLGVSTSSFAQSSKQSTFAAASTVSSSCVIKSVTGLGFGVYSTINKTPSMSSNTLTFNCTKGVSYTITPNTGLNNNALKGTQGDALSYNLYSDGALSVPFGTPSGSQSSLPSVGSYICVQPSSQVTTQPSSGTYLANNAGGSTRYFTNIYSTSASAATCTSTYGGWYFQVVASNPSYNTGCGNGNCGSTTVANAYTSPTLNQSLFFVPALAQGITGVSSSVGTSIVKTIYGKIPASQDVRPDSYNDMVTLTIAF